VVIYRNKIKVSGIPGLAKILYYDRNQIHFKKKKSDNSSIKVVMGLDADLISNICKHNPNNNKTLFTCRLFNILTNEVVEITYNTEELEQAINLAIEYKYATNKKINDIEFINANLIIKSKYFTDSCLKSRLTEELNHPRF